MKLPIDALLPEILARLESSPNLILEASPGSGKTTRVPPALLKGSYCLKNPKVLVLEPRRLAAKLSAQRIAQELHTQLGDLVGYQFRYENLSHPKTRLKFLTEGLFLRLLQSNPHLEGIGAVVLDEFHERHLQSDVALSYLKWLQESHRPDLRIILMSATLDSESLRIYLGNAQIIKLEAQLYPIQVHHIPSALSKSLEYSVKEMVIRALEETPGDILVFLPGRSEILKSQQELSKLNSIKVCLLYGDLSKDEQEDALRSHLKRKVILSTNIAETSLTLPGITAVIDSGLHRRASYSWWSGIPSLKTRPISRASAIQRSGRAGRTQPGVCYRLYTRGDFDGRSQYETPEVTRSDLSQTLLELKASGVSTPHFPWYEPPTESAIKASEELLYRLGAVCTRGELTPLGKQMAQIPAHPRVSRFLIESQKQGVLTEASYIAAALIEGKLEAGNTLGTLHQYERNETLRRTQKFLTQTLEGALRPSPLQISQETSEKIAYCTLMGFPDRVSQARALNSDHTRAKNNEIELLLSSGGSARLQDTGAMQPEEFFILLDLQESQNQSQKTSSLWVRSWIPISDHWLFDVSPQGMMEREEYIWDQKKQRVMKQSRLIYGSIVLSETLSPVQHSAQALELLIKNTLKINPESASLEDWIHALRQLTESAVAGEIESSVTRALIIQKHLGLEPRSFWEELKPFLEDQSSLVALQELNWPTLITEILLGEKSHLLPELLPSHITLPSGRRTPIHYSLSKEPWIQSKLQDFIGMKKAPTLLQGQLPLLIHLLAPNHRPVQVTSDLESFWKNHYPKLRPALSRRYPKHFWPEST